MSIEVGGVFTAIKYTDSSGQCVPMSQGIATYCQPSFSVCSPCPIPPNFTRFIDDVIVLTK